MRKLTLYTDGASRGNPGPAASAWLIMEGVDVLEADSLLLGERTNNTAEYVALKTALKHAKKYVNPTETVVEIFSDSQLMINQLNGIYAVKSADLHLLFNEVKTQANEFNTVSYIHVPRENAYISSCDWMCNNTLNIREMPLVEPEIKCTPIGVVHSPYTNYDNTPCMGRIANDICTIKIFPQYISGLYGLKADDYLFVFCWFDRSDRTILQVHPHGHEEDEIRGVFSTRSPVRPNPVSLTLVRLLSIDDDTLTVLGLDAFDGTLILDIKPYSSEFDIPDNSLTL
ncbi:MAG TPA: tRNA (N6-threonylcarbamoyladenosine(37)-N6)-methyltransferase TrmO [Methanocorpusculum sp.]|nr:tRNA (N6-threonylcarbamoyladenosine(37)-N6)-methyltransferase TrmO [Methanocorpusculum sp.]